eukprot:TRINITY_DN5014_c0_g1_i3.p1 TRINITY_DN5014_c0_g1~~TRINITY_DN5014_c0_g1_i3.p1  ORF type:complete len:229 (-),score=50.76 TRINITY_DN5014_c0_g1_i3:147-773(-)
MCIRDRSTWGIKDNMRVSTVIALALLIVAASASLRRRANNVAAQDFISGLSIGLKLQISPQTINLITENALPRRSLDNAIDTISNPSSRVQGIQLFFNTLKTFSENVDQAVYEEYAFKYILTTTLGQLKDSDQFQYLAKSYKEKTGIDVYTFIDFAEIFKTKGDYLNAGTNFGVAIYLLNTIESPEKAFEILKWAQYQLQTLSDADRW